MPHEKPTRNFRRIRSSDTNKRTFLNATSEFNSGVARILPSERSPILRIEATAA
ncbi:MAG: hypothetical protein AAGH40_03750 [Verrucomicrobiota bacterium]